MRVPPTYAVARAHFYRLVPSRSSASTAKLGLDSIGLETVLRARIKFSYSRKLYNNIARQIGIKAATATAPFRSSRIKSCCAPAPQPLVVVVVVVVEQIGRLCPEFENTIRFLFAVHVLGASSSTNEFRPLKTLIWFDLYRRY